MAILPQFHDPTLTMVDTDGYFLNYSMIMKHLVKAGKNLGMSEEI